jgi:hypothetical protein
LTKPQCQQFVVQVLDEFPLEQFTAQEMSYAIKVKFGHQFSERTVRKVLNELWYNNDCEALHGNPGADRFFKKSWDESTPEEQTQVQRRNDAWWETLRAEWREDFGEDPPSGTTGPAGLWPKDMEKKQS